MKIDTARSRATPEGVSLGLRVAGPPVRFAAWGIDLVVVLTAQFAVTVVAASLGATGTGLQLILFFVLSWFYPVAFEVFRDGSTVGKKAMGILVIHDDGTPVGPSASVLRNLLRVADFLPMAYGAGLVSMLLHPDFQRLGDLAAGTLVVYREPKALERQVPAAAPQAPPVALDPEEQRSIIDFAVRSTTWGLERQIELAELVPSLTGQSGESSVRRLLGMAHWFLGRRGENR